jgi:hypothetical protein
MQRLYGIYTSTLQGINYNDENKILTTVMGLILLSTSVTFRLEISLSKKSKW